MKTPFVSLFAVLSCLCGTAVFPVQAGLFLADEPVLLDELKDLERDLLPGLEGQISRASGSRNPKARISGVAQVELRGIWLESSVLRDEISPLTIGADPSAEPFLTVQFQSIPGSGMMFNCQIGVKALFDAKNTLQTVLANEFMAHGLWITPVGDYQFFAGGPFWTLYNSPLTFGSGIAEGRMNPFLRMPWEGVFPTESHYEYQIMEIKWTGGFEATRTGGGAGAKGVRIDGMKMPFRLSFSAFGGVTDAYSGTLSRLFFGHLLRTDNANRISFNWNVHAVNTSFKADPEEISGSYSLLDTVKLAGGILTAEAALSRVRILRDGTDRLSGAMTLDYLKSYTFGSGTLVPVKLGGYWVPEDFRSVNSAVTRTSPFYSTDSWYLQNILEEKSSYFGNRAGGRLQTGFKAGNFSGEASLGYSATLRGTSNTVAFPHHLLHFEYFYLYNTRADRYEGNPLVPGYATDYEGAYETARLPGAEEPSRKYFSFAEASLRVRLSEFSEVLRRSWLAGRAGISGVRTASLPSPLDGQGLDVYFWEVFCVIGIIPKSAILGFYSEEIFAGPTLLSAVDQTDRSIGAGVNIDLAAGSALYLKGRRFFHEDYVAGRKNDFKGYWFSCEIKSYF